MDLWNRIAAFACERDFFEFSRRVNSAVAEGRARPVETDPNYGRAMIYGGRWISCERTGEVWRLVEPQPPFMGLWEPVLIAGISPTSPACAEARRQDAAPARPRAVADRIPVHRRRPEAS